MKCVVIYFSQTGNTEKVAKAIQEGVKRAAGHCDLVTVREANPRRLYEYDLIGIGCPVFNQAIEPGNVTDFIKNMRFVGGKHTFAFCTHGTMPDFFFPSIVPKLKRRGLVVIGTADWYGNGYLSLFPEPYPTAGHPDEIDLNEAREFGKEMVNRSRKIATGDTHLIPPVPKAPPRMPEEAEVDEVAHSFLDAVKFHKENCLYPKCRLCMDNCPVDGIDLSMRVPVLFKPCIECHFCAKICPTGAIDESTWVAGASKFFCEKVKNLLMPHLAEVEATGKFRSLVPKDKIGFNTPVYKKHNKHPQWVIGKGLQ